MELFAIGSALASGLGSAAAGTAGAAAGAAAGTGAAAAGTGLSLGTMLSAAGTVAGVGGTLAAGYAGKQASEQEAAQYRRRAAEEKAAAGREAYMQRERNEEVISRQRAVAASSGAGVVNPTVLDLFGDTAQRGEYLANTITYGGEQRARSAIDNANAAKAKGKSLWTGSLLDGLAQGISGYSKLRYG